MPRALCLGPLIACCVMGVGVAVAADRGSASQGYETVAWWRFGTEETSKLESHEAAGGGGLHRDQAGPRPPEFPDFEADNTAVRLDGRGAHFRFPDPGDGSPLDFANGDSLTLEAWVNLADIRSGENVYIVGKGRTHATGFPRDNQNWALRLREVGGTARVSFLFRSAPGTRKGEGAAGDWHRWTSAEGIAAGNWHHVAVSYTFGEPDSLSGWLDGRHVRGDWDMGGATKAPPVVDNDAVWIGSSQGGNPGNSFRGLLDEIAIHRGIVPDVTLRSRYRRVAVAGATASKTSQLPAADVLWPLPSVRPGRVQVTVHENLATHESWPSEPRPGNSPVMQWETDLVLFPRLPHRYDGWGIRDAWKPTVLLRAATQLDLPGGKHRLLIRSRGGGRLWLDGRVVARTPFHKREEGGYEPVGEVPQPPAPGGRPVGFGDHEAIVDVALDAGRHTFVFESLVGGKKYRAETGECCAALQLAGEKRFRLLGGSATSPSSRTSSSEAPVWLTDAGWEAAATRQERQLTTLDDAHRRAAAASQQTFWDQRHAYARRWAQQHPPPAVPDVAARWPVHNEIDRFLAAKMERALAAAAPNSQAADFHDKVLPILRDNCFRCHGDKTSGGLRLASRDAALAEGDSGSPAIEPGKPAKSNLIQRIKARRRNACLPAAGCGRSRLPPWSSGSSPAPLGPTHPLGPKRSPPRR